MSPTSASRSDAFVQLILGNRGLVELERTVVDCHINTDAGGALVDAALPAPQALPMGHRLTLEPLPRSREWPDRESTLAESAIVFLDFVRVTSINKLAGLTE